MLFRSDLNVRVVAGTVKKGAEWMQWPADARSVLSFRQSDAITGNMKIDFHSVLHGVLGGTWPAVSKVDGYSLARNDRRIATGGSAIERGSGCQAAGRKDGLFLVQLDAEELRGAIRFLVIHRPSPFKRAAGRCLPRHRRLACTLLPCN